MRQNSRQFWVFLSSMTFSRHFSKNDLFQYQGNKYFFMIWEDTSPFMRLRGNGILFWTSDLLNSALGFTARMDPLLGGFVT